VNDSYNAIAGSSAERLAALSDGVFAVAMTLLVLDIRVPAAETIHGELELWRAFVTLSPRLLMYVMSFMTLGTLLGGSADPAQSSDALNPRADLDSPGFSVRGFDTALFYYAAGGVHGLQKCSADLLGQHPGSRCDALPELDVRH
jgi:hypothetical protein